LVFGRNLNPCNEVQYDLRSIEPVEMVSNPSTGAAKRIIIEALEKGKAIVAVGSCEIVYKGRASSTLGPGERIVIVTEDKALIIHRSYGYRPVNWQPTGCKFRVEESADGKLVVTAIRMNPLESIKMSFDKFYAISTLVLLDNSELCLYASELDMKKAILYRPSLIEDGFTPITSEKVTAKGFVDIFGKDKEGNYVIVEIKRGRATKKAVLQLARYIETPRKGNPSIRGILVADGITKDAQRSIVSLNLEFKRLNPKKCSEILQELERTKDKEITSYF